MLLQLLLLGSSCWMASAGSRTKKLQSDLLVPFWRGYFSLGLRCTKLLEVLPSELI